MKQVTLRWYDAYGVYSMLRDPDKEVSNNNCYASASCDHWQVWGDREDGYRSVIDGVRMIPVRRKGCSIGTNKLAASQEIVRQLQTAGVKAVIRRVAK